MDCIKTYNYNYFNFQYFIINNLIEPNYPEIFYYRGLSKIELKLYNEAISDFE